MNKLKIVLIILLIISGVSFSSETGGQPGAFLRRGVGSRALAMGSAYTSVSNDASALYWNPAGLSEIKQRELFVMFSILTLDRQHLFVSFGYNISHLFSFAIGWNKFGVNNIDGRDQFGNPTKKFSDSENSIMLALSKHIGIISVGVTGKYFYHSVFDRTATGFGFDVGMKIYFNEFLTAGLAVQEISSSLRWNTQSKLTEKIPMNIHAGISFKPKFLSGIAAIEMSKISKNNFVFHAGVEYQIIKFFGVRAGYDGKNLSFGAVVRSPLDFLDIQIDYAATKDIISNGYAHHISLKVGF
jgi:long-subunit fatty acid transport protein